MTTDSNCIDRCPWVEPDGSCNGQCQTIKPIEILTHEPYRQDNQNGMNSLELSTPDFNFGLDYLNVKSVPMTNELSDSLDSYLVKNKDIIF